MNDPHSTAEEELKDMTKRFWDQVDIIEKLAAEVKQLKEALFNRDMAAGTYRAALCVLVDKGVVIHDDDLHLNWDKKIQFDRDEARRCFTIRVVDEKPTTETETQQP